MIEEDLVSIIVPVYKVEKFLDKCLKSLVSQTYTNIEIILIDDESPDLCPKICDTWSGKDSRIRVFHIKNQGVSHARNIAIRQARGTYISFVDSDDFVDTDMIEVMVHAAQRNNAQIVFCGNTHERYTKNGIYLHENLNKHTAFTANSTEEFRSFFPELDQESLVRPVWNKLYNTNFIKKYSKPFSSYVTAGSDAIFNYTLYPHVERAACVERTLYHYVTREGSIAGKYNPKLFESRKYGYKYIRPIIQRWCPTCLTRFDNTFLSEVGLVPVFLHSTKEYNFLQRYHILHNVLHDSEIQEYIKSIHPVGIRNILNFFIFRSHNTILASCYGWCIAMIKSLLRFLRNRK